MFPYCRSNMRPRSAATRADDAFMIMLILSLLTQSLSMPSCSNNSNMMMQWGLLRASEGGVHCPDNQRASTDHASCKHALLAAARKQGYNVSTFLAIDTKVSIPEGCVYNVVNQSGIFNRAKQPRITNASNFLVVCAKPVCVPHHGTTHSHTRSHGSRAQGSLTGTPVAFKPILICKLCPNGCLHAHGKTRDTLLATARMRSKLQSSYSWTLVLFAIAIALATVASKHWGEGCTSLSTFHPLEYVKLYIIVLIFVEGYALEAPEPSTFAVGELILLQKDMPTARDPGNHFVEYFVRYLLPGFCPESSVLWARRLDACMATAVITWCVFLLCPSSWQRLSAAAYVAGTLLYVYGGSVLCIMDPSHTHQATILFLSTSVVAVPWLHHHPQTTGRWLYMHLRVAVITCTYLAVGLTKVRYYGTYSFFVAPLLGTQSWFESYLFPPGPRACAGWLNLMLKRLLGHNVASLLGIGCIVFEFILPVSVLLNISHASRNFCWKFMLAMAASFHIAAFLMIGSNFLLQGLLLLLSIGSFYHEDFCRMQSSLHWSAPKGQQWTAISLVLSSITCITLLGWMTLMIRADMDHMMGVGVAAPHMLNENSMPIPVMSIYVTKPSSCELKETVTRFWFTYFSYVSRSGHRCFGFYDESLVLCLGVVLLCTGSWLPYVKKRKPYPEQGVAMLLDGPDGVHSHASRCKGEVVHMIDSMRCAIVSSICFAAIVVLSSLDVTVNGFLFGVKWIKSCFADQTSSQSSCIKRPHVIIVGASFAGLEAQRGLCELDEFDLTVMDSKDYFEYTPGVLRCFVRPSHMSVLTAQVPRRRNTFLWATALQVDLRKRVLTATATRDDTIMPRTEEHPYDYLLLACGTSYPCAHIKITPCIAQEQAHFKSSLPDRLKEWELASLELTSSSTVFILGGGPVGVELGAEIASSMSSLNVHIITSGNSLCKGLPAHVGRLAFNWLTARGVKVRFCTRVERVAADGASAFLEGGEVLCGPDSGKAIVYDCRGSDVANTGWLRSSLPANSFDARGRVFVKDNLQLEHSPYVFAMGDMVKCDETSSQLAFTAELHAQVAAKNVANLHHGKPLHSFLSGLGLPRSESLPEIFLISLGEGSAILSFNGCVVLGVVPAILKRLIEWSKVRACAERPLHVWLWKVAHGISFMLSRFFARNRKNASAPYTQNGKALLLFDDECLLCNRFVRFVIEHDPLHFETCNAEGQQPVFRFLFGSLQSPEGMSYLDAAGLPHDKATVVLVDEDGVHVRSDAALRVLKHCGYPWRWLHAAFIWVPRSIRDLGYRVVAHLRYPVFGKDGGQTCKRMKKNDLARFQVPLWKPA